MWLLSRITLSKVCATRNISLESSAGPAKAQIFPAAQLFKLLVPLRYCDYVQ